MGTIEKNGKTYQALENVSEFVDELISAGAETFSAEKSGCIIFSKATPGDTLDVYTANGNLETTETAKENQYLATRADLNGSVIVDKNNHTNSWFIDEAVLLKKYQVDKLEEGGFAKPKGGLQRFVEVQALDADGIAFKAPWGEDMVIDNGGVLNITDRNDIYGIQAEEFAETYKAYTNTRDSMSADKSDIAKRKDAAREGKDKDD